MRREGQPVRVPRARRCLEGEVKAAVEFMFEVKVEGVNMLNKPGKTRRFGNIGRPAQWLQEGIRATGDRPVDRLHRRHRE